MRTRAFNIWYRITSGFWFIPAVVTVLAILLAAAAERIDRAVDDEGAAWVYGGSADGARTLLSTVAGSVMTVTGVVFSITIAALTLASQQFGPRLLRQFMKDKGNQVVLGVFIGTFVYCLLVLRLVRGGETPFVPGVSITIALSLALLSLGVLIYFIHHVAATIQANSVIADVGRELDIVIRRVFPKELGAGAPEPALSREDRRAIERIEHEGRAVSASSHGYIEAIDNEGLMKLAGECDVLIRLELKPGDYVVPDAEIAKVMPADGADDEVCARVNKLFILGASRTMEQDVQFGVAQLVEVASRALSPGINDPFTAVAVVDRLGSALAAFMKREPASPYRFDGDGRLRAIAPAVGFEEMIDSAYNQLREYGAGHVMVLTRLLDVLAVLAAEATTDEERSAILRHATMVVRAARQNVSEPHDLRQLEQRYERVAHALGELQPVA